MSQDPYESFNEGVSVEINDLVDFHREMNDVALDALQPTTNELMPMAHLIRDGLASVEEAEVGPFPEGALIAQAMTRRQSDFQHFFSDAIAGLTHISSAAVVVAELYEGGDAENASALDVGFAFADPGARPPDGFRDFETHSDLAREEREEAGGYAMAATGDTSLATPYSYPGGTTWIFPDGSSKSVVHSTTPGVSGYASGTETTTTTIRGSDGEVIQTTVEESYTVNTGRGANDVQTTEVTHGDGSRTETRVSTAPDGTMTVTNQTTDADGNAGDPQTVTVEPGEHNGTADDAGPVEEAEERLDSYGDREIEEAYGRGY